MMLNMKRSKKNNRKLDLIGKREYDFDPQLEIIIYKYVCHMHITKKEKNKLDKKVQFDFYRDWEKYILDKYKNYKKETLVEFSRYLNQRKRNNLPIREYWNLIIPVIMALVLTEAFHILVGNNYIPQGLSIWCNIILYFIIIIFIFLPIIFIVWNTIMPLWDANITDNMLADYIEIIENMIINKERTR